MMTDGTLPDTVGEQVRNFGIPREANQYFNSAAAMVLKPENYCGRLFIRDTKITEAALGCFQSP